MPKNSTSSCPPLISNIPEISFPETVPLNSRSNSSLDDEINSLLVFALKTASAISESPNCEVTCPVTLESLPWARTSVNSSLPPGTFSSSITHSQSPEIGSSRFIRSTVRLDSPEYWTLAVNSETGPNCIPSFGSFFFRVASISTWNCPPPAVISPLNFPFLMVPE